MFSVTVVVLAASFFFGFGLLFILDLILNLRVLKTKVFNLEWNVRKCSIQIEELDAECRRLRIKSRGGGNPF